MAPGPTPHIICILFTVGFSGTPPPPWGKWLESFLTGKNHFFHGRCPVWTPVSPFWTLTDPFWPIFEGPRGVKNGSKNTKIFFSKHSQMPPNHHKTSLNPKITYIWTLLGHFGGSMGPIPPLGSLYVFYLQYLVKWGHFYHLAPKNATLGPKMYSNIVNNHSKRHFMSLFEDTNSFQVALGIF